MICRRGLSLLGGLVVRHSTLTTAGDDERGEFRGCGERCADCTLPWRLELNADADKAFVSRSACEDDIKNWLTVDPVRLRLSRGCPRRCVMTSRTPLCGLYLEVSKSEEVFAPHSGSLWISQLFLNLGSVRSREVRVLRGMLPRAVSVLA